MRFLLFFSLFILASFTSFPQGRESEKEWIEYYKEQVYYNGLLKGLSNKELVKKLISIDNSFYNPVFFNLHEKAISKGGDYLVGLIRKDHIDREGHVVEPASGNRVFLIALRFYQSKKINQMAKEAYLKWVKTPNKKQLIEKASIAY